MLKGEQGRASAINREIVAVNVDLRIPAPLLIGNIGILHEATLSVSLYISKFVCFVLLWICNQLLGYEILIIGHMNKIDVRST